MHGGAPYAPRPGGGRPGNHDAVHALFAIAQAGVAGQADCVSHGDGSGTNKNAVASSTVTVSGSVVPNYYLDPPIQGAPVFLERSAAPGVVIAVGHVDSNDNFSISFQPTQGGAYLIFVPQYPDGIVLPTNTSYRQSTSKALTTMSVTAAVTLSLGNQNGLSVDASGSAQPTTNRKAAKVQVQYTAGSKWVNLGLVAVVAVLAVGGSSHPAAGRTGVRASIANAPADGPIPSSLLNVRVNGQSVDAAANLPIAYDLGIGWNFVDCCPLGGPTTKPFSYGWTIATLIRAAGASPQRTSRVVIERPVPATPITLLPQDFDADAPGGLDFPEDGCTPPSPLPTTWDCPAFIYAYETAPNTSLRFFRPIRAEPPADANDGDWIQSATGVVLSIDITTGADLIVRTNVDSSKVHVGDVVHLAASTTTPITGEHLNYTWALSDGTSLDGPQVTHAFTEPGTYQATAEVTGDKGSGGTGPPVTVVVGKKPDPPGPGVHHPDPKPPTPGGPRGGPVTQQGGHTGAPTPVTRPPTNSGTAGPTSPPGTAAPQPTTPTTPVSRHAAPARPAGTLIRGELLTARDNLARRFDPAGLSASAARATGPSGTTLPRPARRWPLAPTVLCATLLALFLIGAGAERRPRSKRLAPAGTPPFEEEHRP